MDRPLDPCADCGHRAPHTRLAGCLAEAEGVDCPCAVYVPPAPAVVSSPTLAQARAERDAALERVAAGTDPTWEAAAVEAIRTLASRRYGKAAPDSSRVPFTSDDVWDLLAERGAPECREPRALGSIMREAAREGVMTPIGYAPSRRRHLTPIREYRGNL